MKWKKTDKEQMTEREREILFTSMLAGVGIGFIAFLGILFLAMVIV